MTQERLLPVHSRFRGHFSTLPSIIMQDTFPHLMLLVLMVSVVFSTICAPKLVYCALLTHRGRWVLDSLGEKGSLTSIFKRRRHLARSPKVVVVVAKARARFYGCIYYIRDWRRVRALLMIWWCHSGSVDIWFEISRPNQTSNPPFYISSMAFSKILKFSCKKPRIFH